MKTWPKQHKVLLVVCLIFIAVAAATYALVVRPRVQSVKQLENSVTEREDTLRGEGWPVDPGELAADLGQKEGKLERLKQNYSAVVHRAARTFETRLKAKLGDEAVKAPLAYVEFLTYLTRLDYEEDFAEITSKWNELGIVLHENVLNLSQDSVSPHVYQLIFHLWALERCVDLALEHNLAPVRVPVDVPVDGAVADGTPAAGPEAEIETKTIQAAKISVRRIRGYVLNGSENTTPYVVEFPIAMTVQCNMSELTAFLKSLHNETTFLPISRLQIRKIPPANATDDFALLQVDLECSAFLFLRKELEVTPAKKEARILPRGA